MSDSDQLLFDRCAKSGLLICAAVFIFRLLSLGQPGLVDPSEGRFASAALEMLHSGDWITPKIHDYGNGWIPYLAKPPLHMWLVASSLWLFGVNEYAARLPSLLSLAATALLIYWIGKKVFHPLTALFSLAIFSSMLGLLFFAPACLTDATLMFSVALAFSSILLISKGDKRYGSGLLFFVGVALGLLVKGPVALVFIGLPLLASLLLTKEWKLLQSLPWVSGCSLVLASVVPWYLLCEAKNPGFVRYFIIEEHIQRFLTPHTEVRYGAVHTQPRGMILVYLAGVLLPWSVIIPWLFFLGARPSGIREAIRSRYSTVLLFCWAVTPILFFVFARSILPTYVYPTVPAWALLIGVLVTELPAWREKLVNGKVLFRFGVVLLASACVLVTLSASQSLFTGTSFILLCVIFVLSGVLFIVTRQEIIPSILKFVFLAGMTVAIAVMALGGWVSLSRSTRPIVQTLAIRERKISIPIVVLYHDPRSIHFYVTHFYGKNHLVRSGYSQAWLQSIPRARVLIKASDRDKLREGEGAKHLTFEQCLGAWCAYRWKRGG